MEVNGEVVGLGVMEAINGPTCSMRTVMMPWRDMDHVEEGRS